MIKKMITILLVAAMLAMVMQAAFSLAVYAEDNTIRIDGVSRRLTISPIIVDGSQLVGMRDMSNLLAAVIWRDETTGEVVAKRAEVEVRVEIGSTEAIVNGQKVVMPVSARIVGDYTMIPLRFFAEAFGYAVEWDAEKREAVLQKSKSESKSASDEQAEPIRILDLDALDQGDIVLDYDDAVAKVVEKNSSIKELDDWYSRLGEKRREVYLDYVWPPTLLTREYIDGLRSVSEIDYEIMNTQLKKEMFASTAEAALRDCVSAIIKIQMDMALLDENIRLAKFNLEKNLELRFELGLISENDVRDARRSLEQLQRQLDMLRLSLVSEKESLTLILGYSSDEDISVEYRPVYTKGDIDIENLVKEIPKDPLIVTEERKYLQAQYELETSVVVYNTTNPHARQESREEKWIAMESARRKWEDAKSDMEKNMRLKHSRMISLEENHKSLKLALDRAQDAYAAALVNLEAGLITRYDTDMARMDILKAEINLEKNVHDLDAMRFVLERPYLLFN